MEAAHVVVAHQARQRFERVAVAAEIVRFEGRYDQLADFFVQRQLLPRLLHPPLGGLVEHEWIARRRCIPDDAHNESHENPKTRKQNPKIVWCFRAFVAILPHAPMVARTLQCGR
jgi:hypothetical protein